MKLHLSDSFYLGDREYAVFAPFGFPKGKTYFSLTPTHNVPGHGVAPFDTL
jgi:hypothetical protein